KLQQRALQQSKLRRYLAIGEHLQGAIDERRRLLDRLLRRLAGVSARLRALFMPGLPRRAVRHHVLVGDELGAVLLHHLAGEGAAADHEYLTVVLLELFDERDEVAVAADDH